MTTSPHHRSADPVLRVMSFNLRNGAADRGTPNAWPNRIDLVIQAIERFAPDVLGVQECHPNQGEAIHARFPHLAFHGTPRDPDRNDVEMSAIFFRPDRLTPLDAGHFWLSEQPDRQGSRGWDGACTRMASWVRLRPAAGRDVLVLNTHLDHRGGVARLEGAKLVRRRLAELAGDGPAIVTGDFNGEPGSPPYRALVDEADGAPTLIDTFRATHPDPTPDEGTFHKFLGTHDGMRIDWILATPDITPIQTLIDRTRRADGVHPSDHFPIGAVLALPH